MPERDACVSLHTDAFIILLTKVERCALMIAGWRSRQRKMQQFAEADYFVVTVLAISLNTLVIVMFTFKDGSKDSSNS